MKSEIKKQRFAMLYIFFYITFMMINKENCNSAILFILKKQYLIYMYSIAKTLSISICTISNQLSEPYSLLAALPYSYSSDWWFKWFYVIYTLKVPEKLSLYCVFRLIKIYCVIEYTGILWRKKNPWWWFADEVV